MKCPPKAQSLTSCQCQVQNIGWDPPSTSEFWLNLRYQRHQNQVPYFSRNPQSIHACTHHGAQSPVFVSDCGTSGRLCVREEITVHFPAANAFFEGCCDAVRMLDAILGRPRYFFSVYAELSDPQLLAWHLVLSLEFYSTRNLAASSKHSLSSDWRVSCMMVREKTSARRNFLAACIARSFARSLARSQPRPRIAPAASSSGRSNGHAGRGGGQATSSI